MSYPPKLRKEEKNDYRRRKRRLGRDTQSSSGNITATVIIPANSTQGVVVQPFNIPMFSQPQPAVINNNNDSTGTVQNRAQIQRQYRGQYHSQYQSQNQGPVQGSRKQVEKKKSPPPGDLPPIPKKKRGLESDRDKFWAVIYPYKDISSIRGNVIYGSYNSLYKDVSRSWWTDWETEEEAEDALHGEMMRRKDQHRDLLARTAPLPPLAQSTLPTEKPDLRLRLNQRLSETRTLSQLRPDLPATIVVNQAKELEMKRAAAQVATDPFEIEMPPRPGVSSSSTTVEMDVVEVNKSNLSCYSPFNPPGNFQKFSDY